jgi:protein deglycase
MKKRALILLADGFEEIEAVTCLDLLRRAGIQTEAVSIGENNLISSSHKVKIQADIKISEIKTCLPAGPPRRAGRPAYATGAQVVGTGLPDAVILPGGMPGAENLAGSKEAMDLIKRCFNEDKVIAAICASPAIVLSKIGILDDRKATCYPGFEDKFKDSTTFIDKEVVVDENIITSQGPGTAGLFALEIIKRLKGEETAETVRKNTLIK